MAFWECVTGGIRSGQRALQLTLVVSLMVMAGCAGVARASISASWSSPAAVDKVGGTLLYGVACPSGPSGVQCTAIDGKGQEVTFDPSDASTPTPIKVDDSASGYLAGVACPSTTQCTAIDASFGAGGEVTFNPTDPGNPTLYPIENASTTYLRAIACPASNQCTAVDAGGGEVTFDPTNPGAAKVPVELDSDNGFTAVDCPLATQCTATADGNVVTFNPQAPSPASSDIVGAVDPNYMIGISCPSADQCTAVESLQNPEHAVTFNPETPTSPTPNTLSLNDGQDLYGVSCSSTTQCATIDGKGNEMSFNPNSTTAPTPAPIDGGRWMYAIACPSALTTCVAVDQSGYEVSFNPSAGTSNPELIDSGGVMTGVACPSTTQCTATDENGEQVTFNQTAVGTPSPTVVYSSDTNVVDYVACPSTTQCTTVDEGGRAVTFNPISPGSPTPATIGAGEQLISGLVCPSVGDCVAVGICDGCSSYAISFVPGSSAAPTDVNDVYGEGVSCPSITQCTSTGGYTFSPTATTTAAPTALDGTTNYLTAISCPSTTQCTGVDDAGNEVTFNPVSATVPTPVDIDAHNHLTGIDCPATNGCIAVDGAGNAVVFDPGDPSGATITKFANPSLEAINCAGTTQCVAVDEDGNAYAAAVTITSGNSSPSPSVTAPVTTGRPVVSGSATPANTLSCSSGTWTESPGTFAYQWLRNGQPIAGATASRYAVQIVDEAERLSCQVTASNSAGAGTATSTGTIVTTGGAATLKCPKPSGALSGATLGPLKLGMTQAQARKKLAKVTVTHNGFDEFCLYAGWGIRVAYPSRALLKTLAAKQRPGLTGRIVVMLTANPHYHSGGIAPGATQAAAVKALKPGKPFKVGANTWYVKHASAGTLLLKVQKGIVQEVGLANAKLTASTSEDQQFLRSFGTG